MAVSLCRSLQVHAPGVSFGIRWPNDVWVQGKKIAGILVEVPASAATTRRLVVGVGVNVNNPLREAPPDLRDGATSLIEVGARAFDLTEVLIALLKRFEIDLDRLVAGSPELPDEWKSLCLLRGSVVTIAQGTRQFRGVAREIDSDGALVLESQGRLTRFFGGVLTSVEKVEQTSAARRGSNGSSPGG
jgi:BirA family biotin operon repressor/biotin-[acetyl-CoA-carboxylase] ligase